MLDNKISWSGIIRLVLLWLVLKLIIDIVYGQHVASSIFSFFFYVAGVVSGIGLMSSYDRQKNEKRRRIMEIVKAIKETYKS